MDIYQLPILFLDPKCKYRIDKFNLNFFKRIHFKFFSLPHLSYHLLSSVGSNIFNNSMITFCARSNSVAYSSFVHSIISNIEWLAGYIDGDGYFCSQLTPAGKKRWKFRILASDQNKNLIIIVISIVGYGHINLVKGKQINPKDPHWDYTITKGETLIKLINLVNGHIRNTVRLNQFINMLNDHSITLIQPKQLTMTNSWLAVFFYADGHIRLTITKTSPAGHLEFSIVNKFYENLIIIYNLFNCGKIR